MSETKYVISRPIAVCLLVLGGLVTYGAQQAIAAYESIEAPSERDALSQYQATIESCRIAIERDTAGFGENDACKDMVRKRLAVRARTDQQIGDYYDTIHREMDIYRRITYDVFELR